MTKMNTPVNSSFTIFITQTCFHDAVQNLKISTINVGGKVVMSIHLQMTFVTAVQYFKVQVFNVHNAAHSYMYFYFF